MKLAVASPELLALANELRHVTARIPRETVADNDGGGKMLREFLVEEKRRRRISSKVKRAHRTKPKFHAAAISKLRPPHFGTAAYREKCSVSALKRWARVRAAREQLSLLGVATQKKAFA